MTGWQCPGCSRCYSPAVIECLRCGQLTGVITTGTVTITCLHEYGPPSTGGTRTCRTCRKCGQMETHTVTFPPTWTVFSALALALTLVLAGCGASWQDVARGGIETSAGIVDRADTLLGDGIRSDCTSATLGLAPGSEERKAALQACLHGKHYDDLLAAIAVADHALRATQAAVDMAVRAGQRNGWLSAGACLVVSVRQVLSIAVTAGLRLPDDVSVGLSAISALVGRCEAP